VALKFYSSVRIEVKAGPKIKSASNEILGNVIWVKIVKNKLAPPFRSVQFDIIYGKGISSLGILVDEAVNAKIIQKKGSWYSYENIQLGQGKDQTKEYFIENPKVKAQIEKKVKKALGIETPIKNEDNKDKQEKK